MQHHRAQRKLGRVRSQRTALLRSLARELFVRGSINTTIAKAKEVRPFAERLITASKKNTIASRRHVSAELGNEKDVVNKLHDDIAPKYKDRPGGYTRITKLGRIGARVAEEARIELV